MSASTPAPKDSPIVQAWTAYQATDEYKNSWAWAADYRHRDGSMWAAFLAGWIACDGRTDGMNDGIDEHDNKIREALVRVVGVLDTLTLAVRSLYYGGEHVLGPAARDALSESLRAAKKAVAALRSAPVSEWRPMSEAPRDGTVVHVRRKGDGLEFDVQWSTNHPTHGLGRWVAVEYYGEYGDWHLDWYRSAPVESESKPEATQPGDK